MTAFSRVKGFWGGLVALLVLSSAAAQQNAPAPEGYAPMVAKDARTRAKAHTDLGSLYFQNGNLIVALEELTLAAAIDPTYAPAFSTRGLILYHVKELDSAEKDFRQALSLDERNPEIQNNFGWFLCHTQRAEAALEYFERAYRNPLYQTPAIAYMNAGACRIPLGQLERAEDMLRLSLRFSPDNPEALYHLAHVSYLQGNFDAAKQRLDKAVTRSDPGPELLWLLLRIERRLGNQAEEQSLAAQLRRKFPDSPEYQALLKGEYQ